MHVEIVNHTPDPERVVALAARQCYSAGFVMDFASTPERDATLLRRVMASGHTSVLEHFSVTFAVEGVSRCLSHQLVRHRVGVVFSQQSQRYVESSEDFERIMPQSILDAAFSIEVDALWERTGRLYKEMLEAGIPPEDARYILPNATETKLVMTVNARELLHFFSLRCCQRAQWEIRGLANEMLRLVKEVAPVIFKKAGASCVAGDCPEGAMGCGKKQGNSPAGKE